MGLFLPRGNDLPLSDHWVSRSIFSTAGTFGHISKEWPLYCRKVHWTKMAQKSQNDHLVKMTLFRTGFWHSRDQNGPFWPKDQEPLNGPFLNGLFSRRFSRGKTAH